jgi:hypothetical protein
LLDADKTLIEHDLASQCIANPGKFVVPLSTDRLLHRKQRVLQLPKKCDGCIGVIPQVVGVSTDAYARAVQVPQHLSLVAIGFEISGELDLEVGEAVRSILRHHRRECFWRVVAEHGCEAERAARGGAAEKCINGSAAVLCQCIQQRQFQGTPRRRILIDHEAVGRHPFLQRPNAVDAFPEIGLVRPDERGSTRDGLPGHVRAWTPFAETCRSARGTRLHPHG